MNLRRVFALVKKELAQIVRDPSSILIAFILPIILLFLFGFGINFDTNTVKIGVIIEDKNPTTVEILDTMRHSRFLDVKVFNSRREADDALLAGSIRGYAVIPNDFTRRLKRASAQSSTGGSPGLAAGASSGVLGVSIIRGAVPFGNFAAKSRVLPEIQVITDGSEPNTAKFVSSYVQGALSVYGAIKAYSAPAVANASGQAGGQGGSKISIIERFWYNPALKSTYFILPGSLAIIMTMTGTVLTALVIAREWERGTMEAILTTKVTEGEFLLSKYAAYFLLSILSIIFCLVLIIFLFRVPFYGSFWALITVSSFFMLGALGFGFFVSTLSKEQFVASQIAGVVGFMPAMMLSGLIYEINSMPWFLRVLTLFIPARYYVSSITSLFLSGTIPELIIRDSLILGGFALVMFVLVYKITPNRLEG